MTEPRTGTPHPPRPEMTDKNVEPTPAQTLTGRSIHAEKAHCPKHGAVSAGFRVYATFTPQYSTQGLCPLCYVDWVAANVMHTTTAHRRHPLAGQEEG